LLEECSRQENGKTRCKRVSQHYGLVPVESVSGNAPNLRVDQKFIPEQNDNGQYVMMISFIYHLTLKHYLHINMIQVTRKKWRNRVLHDYNIQPGSNASKK